MMNKSLAIPCVIVFAGLLLAAANASNAAINYHVDAFSELNLRFLQRHFITKNLSFAEAMVNKMIKAKDVKGLAQLIQGTKRMSIERQRLAKCVAQLGSASICKNEVSFYLWAQLLAKEIMSGN